jgi:hypothetical protein
LRRGDQHEKYPIYTPYPHHSSKCSGVAQACTEAATTVSVTATYKIVLGMLIPTPF